MGETSETGRMSGSGQPDEANPGTGGMQTQPDPAAANPLPPELRTAPSAIPLSTPSAAERGSGTAVAPAARGTVRSIHYRLSYVTQNIGFGPRGALVLLHDLPGGAFSWDGVLPTLTGRAVCAFDMLGYGQSDHPWPSDTSIWGHADSLSYALNALQLTDITLVGIGLGAAVAQVLATRLYRDQVARLVLINSYAYRHAYAENWPLPDMLKRHDPDLPRQTPLEQLLADLRATLPQGAVNALPDARLRAYLDEWNSELGKEMLYQHIRLMLPDYMNSVSTDVVRLRIPILLLWGERDTVTPLALGQRIAAENPNARLQVIPGAGHLLLDDAPSAVASALGDFIGARA